MDKLSAVATVNLWGTNYWQARKNILINELSSHGLNAKNPVILAFQEVEKGNLYPLMEVAKGLGFEEKQVYFFPTLLSGTFGLGIITNLEVVKRHYTFFTYDSTDPLEFGERGIGLLALKDKSGPVALGITHLSVSEKIQYIHAFESIHALQEFAVNQLDINSDEKHQLLSGSLAPLCEKIHILLAGDFNAAPELSLYQLFKQSGLTDYTYSLQKKYQFSWPTNVQWLIRMHKKTFGRNPPFDIEKLQRWIDYIWGCGFSVKKHMLLGTIPNNDMYPSDHAIPVVYF